MQKNISLIEFSVENWGPFDKKATFSMSARKKDGHTFSSNGENVLKTSLIYGPNASGKSSVLNAFRGLKRAILFSANTVEGVEDEKKLPSYPFLASKDTTTKPTFFEVLFSLENTAFDGVYKYSFSVSVNTVISESLVEVRSSGEDRSMINRIGNVLETDDNFKEISDFLTQQQNFRADALFLSVAAQLNNKFAMCLQSGFRNMNVITGIQNDGYRRFTLNEFRENNAFRAKVLKYLHQADFCIKGGEVRDIDSVDSSGKIRKILDMFFLHPVFGKGSEEVDTFELPLEKESDGTKSFFNLLGPVIDTIENGKVLFVDELDNSLHPLLTEFIVALFESEEVNTNHAQLIATTHDTSLLANKKFIKDQFWFTEKDGCGAAKLFSLAEFSLSLRNDTEYSKKYLEGRFGALPIVGMVSE